VLRPPSYTHTLILPPWQCLNPKFKSLHANAQCLNLFLRLLPSFFSTSSSASSSASSCACLGQRWLRNREGDEWREGRGLGVEDEEEEAQSYE
jgi:hypothetical protein